MVATAPARHVARTDAARKQDAAPDLAHFKRKYPETVAGFGPLPAVPLAEKVAGLFSPFTLFDGVRMWLGGTNPADSVLKPGAFGAVYALVLLVLVGLCLAGLAARGVPFELEVIPGISSVSVLAARHRITLNRIGSPVQITTGRRLAEQWPPAADDVVVMLDARAAFEQFATEDVDIFWGAYLGTPDEILVSGPLTQVAGRIAAERAEARERKGWIMDTYLLRRSPEVSP